MAFDVITPVKLGQAAITTSPTILYTTPASTRTFVKDIDICNTTTASITVNVYLVPSAGSPATSNALFYNIDLPASASSGGLMQWEGSQILEAGDTIQIEASAVGLTINASGGEAV